MPVPPGGGDAVGGAGRHERRFQGPNQRPDHQAAARQRQDRVGDQLAGPVVGDLATALDLDHLDPAGAQLIGRGEDMRRVGVPSQGQDGRMLQQQQLVADPIVGTLGRQPALEGMGLAVVDPAEPSGARSAQLLGSIRRAPERER